MVLPVVPRPWPRLDRVPGPLNEPADSLEHPAGAFDHGPAGILHPKKRRSAANERK